MIFLVLLSPLAAMGFLTAMEWVERWTLDDNAPGRDTPARPVRVRPVRRAQAPSVRATPTGHETPVPPIPQ